MNPTTMAFPNDPRTAQLIVSHEQVIEALSKLHARLTGELIPAVRRLANVTHPALLPWRAVIVEKVDQSLQRLQDLDETLQWLRQSGPLPIQLWLTASEWTPLRTVVSSVAGELSVTNREVHLRWQGIAADTYAAVIPSHREAAQRLATAADTLQFALNWAASAVAQMYAAVLGLIVGLFGAGLVALAAAVTAVTAVGAVAGLVALLVAVGTVLGAVSTLLVTAMQTLGTGRTWLSKAASELADHAAFPDGRWPAARPEWFLDTTTADGDPSDWTVR